MADDNEIVLGVSTGDSNQQLKAMEDRLVAVFTAVNKLTATLGVFGDQGGDALQIVLGKLADFQKASRINPGLLTPYISELQRAASAAGQVSAAVKQINLEANRTPRQLANARQSTDPERVAAGVAGARNVANERRLALAQLEAEGAAARKITIAKKELAAATERQILLEERLAQLTEKNKVAADAARYNAGQTAAELRQRARAATPRGQAQAAAQAEQEARVEAERQAAIAARTQARADALAKRQQAQADAALPQAIAQRTVARAASQASAGTEINENNRLFSAAVAAGVIKQENNAQLRDAIGVAPTVAANRRAQEVSSAEREDFTRDPANQASARVTAARNEIAIREQIEEQGGLTTLQELNLLRRKQLAAANALVAALNAEEKYDRDYLAALQENDRRTFIAKQKEALAIEKLGNKYDADYAKAELENSRRDAVAGRQFDRDFESAQRENVRRTPALQASNQLASTQNNVSRTEALTNEEYINAKADLVQSTRALDQAVKAEIAAREREANIEKGLSVEEEALQLILREDRLAAVRESAKRQREELGNAPPVPGAPRSRDQVLQQSRDNRHDYLFGDGGANLLTTQVAIQANYVALGLVYEAFTKTVSAVLDFDKALQNLSAVSGATKVELGQLSETLLDISKSSTFSATELAQSAEELAKAGFSLSEITSILNVTATLAGATGTGLKETTDLTRQLFTTFNIQSSEANKVLDQTFVALDTSRLTLDKYKTSLSDAGVTAKETGVSLAEFNSILTTLTDKGLTESNQLNQGLRQVFTALADPTAKLKSRIAELGLSVADIDPRIQSVTGAFENLNKAGFTSADAFQTLGARVATTFVTLLNSTEAQKANYQAQLQATGATEAQSKALTSTIDKATILANSFQELAIKSAGPLKNTLGELASALTYVVKGVGSFQTGTTILTTALSALAITAVVTRIGALLGGLKLVQGGITALLPLTNLFNVALGRTVLVGEGAAAASLTLGAALGAVARAFGPLLVIGTIISLFELYANSTEKATKTAEELQTAENATRAQIEEKGKTIERVSGFIENMANRSESLRNNSELLGNTIQEARNQFADLSITNQDNIHDFDTLISKLITFRQELRATADVSVVELNKQLRDKLASNSKEVDALTSDRGIGNLAKSVGLGQDLSQSLGGAEGVPIYADASRAQNIKDLQEKFKGNKAAQDAIAFANLPADQRTSGQARDILQGIDKSPALPGAVFTQADLDALRKFTSELAAVNGDSLRTNNAIAVNDRKLRQTKLTEDFVAGGNAPKLVDAQAALGGARLDGISDATERQRSLAQIQGRIGADLDGTKKFLDGLSPEDRKNFNETEEGKLIATIQAKTEELVSGVNKYAADTVKASTDLTKEALTRDYQLASAKVTAEKDPKLAKALVDNAKAIAEQLRLAQYRQIDADTEANKKLAKGDPKNLVAAASLKKLEADDEYDKRVVELNAALKRDESRRAPIDPNRATPLKLEDYAGGLEKQDKVSARQTAETISNNANPLKAQEAFIDAAKKGNQFSEATISAAEQKLQKLKIAQEGVDIDAYLKRLDVIDQITQKVKDDLATVNARIDELTSKYGIKVDGEGNISGNFGSGPDAERTRQETIKLYNQLLAQRSKLGGDDGSGGLVGQLAGERTTVQDKANGLGVEQYARQQSSQFDPAKGFSDASQLFSKQHGGDTSAQKEYTDDLTKVFNAADTSFSTFIQNLVTGTAKGKNAFKDFATSIIKDMLSIASQKASNAILGQLFNLVTSAFSGGVNPAPDGGIGPLNPSSGLLGHAYQGAVIKAYQGMNIPKFDGGGIIDGTAIGRDNVAALLAPGEAILNRSAVSLVGEDNINQMNSGALRQQKSIPQLPAPREPDKVNVYVVDKNTTPTLGKKDVLATVGEDILAGGATKKLIQQVALGTR